MEANCWNYLCSQPLSAFRIVYSRSNRAWGAESQPCHGSSPCIYHPVSPIGALFFRFDARPLASGKVTNKLPVDFLEPCVQTVHTAERGAVASPRWYLPCFFRGLLLAGTDDGPFPGPNGRSSENT